MMREVDTRVGSVQAALNKTRFLVLYFGIQHWQKLVGYRVQVDGFPGGQDLPESMQEDRWQV